MAEAAAPSQEMFEEHPSLEENEAEIAAPSQEMVEEHPSNETLVENWIENTFPSQELEEKEDVQDLIAGAFQRTKADYDMLLTISKHTLHSEIDFLPENMREGLSSEELRRDGEEKLETCAVLYCLMEQTCLLCQFENREEIRKQQHSQSQTQSHQ
ncbi:GL13012 [Drosophila persimilis]|uniref:GL13012 n=1 Tax=Drosophila persimilis TaxID=7234 RepID=B4GVE7_DROPE|nr:GL13012 [Drosophila persimilis]